MSIYGKVGDKYSTRFIIDKIIEQKEKQLKNYQKFPLIFHRHVAMNESLGGKAIPIGPVNSAKLEVSIFLK